MLVQPHSLSLSVQYRRLVWAPGRSVLRLERPCANDLLLSQVTRTNKTHVDDADAEFVSKVLGTTEDHWHKVFQAEGRTYHEPK